MKPETQQAEAPPGILPHPELALVAMLLAFFRK